MSTIITICGNPVKQEQQITYIAERMTCSGKYCVLTPIVPFIKHNPTGLGVIPSEIRHLADARRQKIDLSSAILVMDDNGVVDPVTECDIAYARAKKKQILYYSQEIHNWR